MIVNTVLELIGNTPLLYLNKISAACGANIFVKMEMLQPGGSIKARTALNMVEMAEKAGLLNKNSIIVEATSGNQGIALAMIGAVKGYKVRIVMPENMSIERKRLIKAYGAEIISSPAGSNIGEAIENAIKIVRQMALEDENVFLPKQFENLHNPQAHEDNTAQEILKQMEGKKIDAFISGFGTGGTFTGIGEVLRKYDPKIKLVIAEPEHAAVLSNKPLGHHNQQGIGDGIIPNIMNTGLVDDVVIVSDFEAEEMARRLAKEEGILCGVSSGTNVFAAVEYAKKLPKGANIITNICDTGERYISTSLFAE